MCGAALGNPIPNLVEGLGKIHPVNAHTQNLHVGKSAAVFLCVFPYAFASLRLCVQVCHFFPAAASNTASVSRAAFSQEKRLTFL